MDVNSLLNPAEGEQAHTHRPQLDRTDNISRNHHTSPSAVPMSNATIRSRTDIEKLLTKIVSQLDSTRLASQWAEEVRGVLLLAIAPKDLDPADWSEDRLNHLHKRIEDRLDHIQQRLGRQPKKVRKDEEFFFFSGMIVSFTEPSLSSRSLSS